MLPFSNTQRGEGYLVEQAPSPSTMTSQTIERITSIPELPAKAIQVWQELPNYSVYPAVPYLPHEGFFVAVHNELPIGTEGRLTPFRDNMRLNG